MIGKLKGLYDSSGTDWLIVDVGGVGYHVFCSGQTLRNLPLPNNPIMLYIDTHVREDHIHLYGFLTQEERSWFRTLLSIQGVGGKVALSILTCLTPEQLYTAIVAEDKKALTQADGVGPKVAMRLITELKEKIVGLSFGGESATVVSLKGHAPTGNKGIKQDAISALSNLGYTASDAFTQVTKAITKLGDDVTLDQIIKAALKELQVG